MADRVSPEELQQFYHITEQASLRPGWLGRARAYQPKVQPFLWRWAEVEPLVHRSGEVVTPDRDVERRVLRLANPGLEHGTTHTISIQDIPVMQALSLYWEEPYQTNAGHQPIASRFAGKK